MLFCAGCDVGSITRPTLRQLLCGLRETGRCGDVWEMVHAVMAQGPWNAGDDLHRSALLVAAERTYRQWRINIKVSCLIFARMLKNRRPTLRLIRQRHAKSNCVQQISAHELDSCCIAVFCMCPEVPAIDCCVLFSFMLLISHFYR